MNTRPTSKNRPSLLANRPLMILVVVAILGVIGLAFAASQGAAPPFTPEVIGAPHAQVDTTLIDHGDVKMEDFAESIFRVRNAGDQTLRILGEPRVELVQGCCPPRAIVSRSTLGPGEEATITLRFTMHEMMGGPHEFRVHVQTNDPAQPLIPLTILSNWVE
ncbi:MAG: DUF1573 domain-containing protein [Anaerolineae bacterium]|nr:DUF1573 domain-containing protein [Anaerolineae bacterium]